MLSPILHPASGRWMLGKIEEHTAHPLSREEIEAHIAEHERLRQLCAEQSSALKWAKQVIDAHETAAVERGDC